MKVLMVIAHADDEIIFGWPILQDSKIEKQILCCSSDRYNEERKWCSHRGDVFKSIYKNLGINCNCLDYNSEFYRMETRKESLSKMQEDIVNNIKKFDFDYIFTHNPLGEYGHLDHKMTFDTIFASDINKPILYTDICFKTNWPSCSKIPERYVKPFYHTCFLDNCSLDINRYSQIENEYRKSGVWTWSFKPVDKCNIYSTKD
jgi:hypothetical protein